MNKDEIKIIVEEFADSAFLEISESDVGRITKKTFSCIKNYDIESFDDIKEEFDSLKKEEYDYDSWEEFTDELANFVLDIIEEQDDIGDDE